MKIIYHLVAGLPMAPESTPASVDGDTITVEGVVYDLSPLLEGATIKLPEPFIRPVRREGGQVVVELAYFYDDSIADLSNIVADTGLEYVLGSGTTPIPVRYKPVENLYDAS